MDFDRVLSQQDRAISSLELFLFLYVSSTKKVEVLQKMTIYISSDFLKEEKNLHFNTLFQNYWVTKISRKQWGKQYLIVLEQMAITFLGLFDQFLPGLGIYAEK